MNIFIFIFFLVICVNNIRTQTVYFVNDSCTLSDTKKSGHCIEISNCQYALNLLKESKIPTTCGFLKNAPLVCCPDAQKIGQLKKLTCSPYRSQPITGGFIAAIGDKALPQEFPHMAAIGFEDANNNTEWLCGGTLINNFFVLTAAHCVHSLEHGPAKLVRLGDLNLTSTTEDAKPLDFKIAETFVHPQYKLSSHYHDIALFKLDKEVIFDSRYYQPACLQTAKELPDVRLKGIGWGKTGFLEERSNYLIKARLQAVDHETCTKRYKSFIGRKLQNGILDEYQICAGDVGGHDTCAGDSGGPLNYVVKNYQTGLQYYVVVGVTSFGKPCGGEDTLGVYTRVSAYIDWIESIVWKK